MNINKIESLLEAEKYITNKNKELLQEINNLILDFDLLTTSDFQGICDTISIKYDIDSNDLINYIESKQIN